MFLSNLTRLFNQFQYRLFNEEEQKLESLEEISHRRSNKDFQNMFHVEGGRSNRIR